MFEIVISKHVERVRIRCLYQINSKFQINISKHIGIIGGRGSKTQFGPTFGPEVGHSDSILVKQEHDMPCNPLGVYTYFQDDESSWLRNTHTEPNHRRNPKIRIKQKQIVAPKMEYRSE